MNKQIIVLIVLIVLIVPLIQAELPPVKVGQCASIQIPYNATWINISTMTYPNQSIISLNIATIKVGNTFYYNGFCDTSQIGTYSYQFFADDGFSSGNIFQVTPNGDIMNTSQALIYIILLIINLSALAIFITLSIKIPYENKMDMTKDGPAIIKITKSKYAKLLCIWISYGLFLWFMTIIAGMVNNYINYQSLKDMTTNLYIFSSIIGWGLSTAMIWFIFINLWKDILFSKTIQREGKALLNSK